MFPLGSAFPGSIWLRILSQVLTIVFDLAQKDSFFGTCLIERGHEVGGQIADSLTGRYVRSLI